MTLSNSTTCAKRLTWLNRDDIKWKYTIIVNASPNFNKCNLKFFSISQTHEAISMPASTYSRILTFQMLLNLNLPLSYLPFLCISDSHLISEGSNRISKRGLTKNGPNLQIRLKSAYCPAPCHNTLSNNFAITWCNVYFFRTVSFSATFYDTNPIPPRIYLLPESIYLQRST